MPSFTRESASGRRRICARLTTMRYKYSEAHSSLELEAMIEAARSRLDSTGEVDQSVLRKYHENLAASARRILECPTLLLEGINCVGEVRLSEHDDFADWGIEILVKFRDHERLQVLTGQRQSGGVRSSVLEAPVEVKVANGTFGIDGPVPDVHAGTGAGTIPRCRRDQPGHGSAERTFSAQPDGRDRVPAEHIPVSETTEAVLEVTKRAAPANLSHDIALTTKPAYFLITPKLLPDLEYHPRMKVLCIYSGDWQPFEFNIKGYINEQRAAISAQ
ncbi:MAG: hypothetical protein BJ554DRAFT_3101 [Olpidium bornovanus]|uniref:Uncharacterized protein n=1 Tax=Olpidium bornovanus TaxID=278681 RepID=A0A8H8DLL6_9FUNG|nr:MAG: hypothetical protein BJ554DRAFT_3101 [Olpidium bornovanus]